MWSIRRAIIALAMVAGTGCSSSASEQPGNTTTPAATSETVTTTAPAPTTALLNDTSSVRAELDVARSAWAEVGVDRYRLEVSEHRNYWSRGCRWTSIVDAGTIVEAPVEDSDEGGAPCSEIYWTVELLFDEIERMANEIDAFARPDFGVHTLEVEFAETGVPEVIDFDLANGADEETLRRIALTSLSG